MSKLIMLVEDNALNTTLFTDLLTANGYEVIHAPDADHAFQIVDGHRPDLILMDINLPGMSGIDITKTLKAREELRDIPIVAVTASITKGDELSILEAGCAECILKPISLPQFLETVARYAG